MMTTLTKEENEVRGMLATDRDGMARNSITNCVTALTYDPVLAGAIARNLLTGRIDVIAPIGRPDEVSNHTLSDTDERYIRWRLEKIYGLTSEKKIADAIDIIAETNKYHPIRQRLESLHWDRVERIACCLHHFFGCAIDTYTQYVFNLFLMGAINRIYHPGCKFDYMLCLVGGQGAGKSTFFRFLSLDDAWFSDDLRRLDDDNVYRKLQGHWIIEMSEMLATANAKSIEDIKAFMSRQKEVYKVPYEVHPEDRLRQCVFAGTSNDHDFLPLDRSGNRRFLPVPVYPELAEVHILNDESASRAYIEQVWAEAMTIFRENNYSLSINHEMSNYLKRYQQQYMREDVNVGLIRVYLDSLKSNIVCSKQIYHEALNHAYDKVPNQRELHEINDIMANSIPDWKRFDNPRAFGRYGRQKGWERIPLATDSDNGTPCKCDRPD